MNRTINHLVTHNLATREIDPRDRRYIMIQLTPSGSKAFQTIENSMEAFFANVFDSIPENKREQVIDSLTILLEALAAVNCCRNLMEEE